jgi:hypothetical protein
MKLFNPRLRSNAVSPKPILAAIALCLLVGFVSAFYFRSTRKNAYRVRISAPDGSSSSIDFSAMEGVTVLNLRSEQREQISLRSSCNTLVIFISPGDCPNCLKERSVWENLAKSYEPSQLRVMPILVNTSEQESRPFSEFLNMPQPVYYDDTRQLAQEAVTPKETPFKALVDRNGVLLAQGPNPKASEQTECGNKVRATLSKCGV